MRPAAIEHANAPLEPLGGPVIHAITESVPFGGAQRNTLLTVEGLRRDGVEVDLVCGAPGGELALRARAAGARVHVVPELVRTTDPPRDLRCLVRLHRLFRARRPAVVHTHSTKAGWLGRLAAFGARVPVVVHTVHGLPFVIDGSLRSRVYVAVERGLGRVTDATICVAEALRDEVSSWRLSGRIDTIYSGIDFSAYSSNRTPAEVRRVLGLDGAGPIVGSIGHLREAKRHERLVEAVARLRERYPRIRLLLVGEGERRAAIERRVAELGMETHVRLLGERSDIADLLGVFDVYALSSRWEGVGRALTEAMYAALPVVATSVYGIPELVRDGETGVLVEPENPAALAAAIDRLLADRTLARRLGTEARRRVVTMMDGEQMIVSIERLYGELAAGRLRKHRKKETHACAESPAN